MRPCCLAPAPSGSPRHRFDPGWQYRIAYLAGRRAKRRSRVLLREPDMGYVTMRDVRSRRVTQLRVCRTVTLVSLHGPGLVGAGVTAAVATGDDYPRSCETALGIWGRADHPDGVAYRARDDDGEMSVALFDRAADAIEVVGSAALDDDPRWLASMASRYVFEFAP